MKRAAIAGAWLALLLAAIDGPTLVAGKLLATGDALAQDFPARLLVAAAIRHGEWPFWNPFNFGGMPLLATLQPGVFFPGNWPFLLLPPAAALGLAVLAAYWVAGMGLYAYMRALGTGFAGATLAATLCTGGGFLAQNVMHPPILQAACLVPWGLWAIERHARAPDGRFAWACGWLFGLAVLAGHPQLVAFGGVLAGAYALYRGFALPRERRAGFWGRLVLAAALGLALSAAMLWPGWDVVQASQRHAMSFAKLATPSPAPFAAALLWFPLLAGVRVPDAWLPTPIWALEWTIWLPAYCGLVALALVPLALARWRVEPAVRFWAAAGAFAFALALGTHTPLFRLWAAVPPFNVMPYPARHFFEASLALAVLAGIGCDALARGEVSARARALALAIVALPIAAVWAALALRGTSFIAHTQPFVPAGVDLSTALSWRAPALWLPVLDWAVVALLFGLARRRAAIALLGLVAAVELLGVNHYQGYQRLGPVWTGQTPTFALEPYRGRAFAVAAEPYPYYGPLAPLLRLEMPCLSALDGVRTVNGYDAFIPRRQGELWALDSSGYPADLRPWANAAHALDLAGLVVVRIDARAAATPAWRRVLASPRWQPLPGEPGVEVYANTRALPRAWRPTRARMLPAATVDALVRGEGHFDPAIEALLEEPPVTAGWRGGTARVTSPGFNRLRLETSGAGPGLVAIAEGYDPGWRASTAEGTPCPVHRLDGLILGVEVPAGTHLVELRYEPVHWRAGAALSLAALAGFLLWGLSLFARREAAG